MIAEVRHVYTRTEFIKSPMKMSCHNFACKNTALCVILVAIVKSLGCFLMLCLFPFVLWCGHCLISVKNYQSFQGRSMRF